MATVDYLLRPTGLTDASIELRTVSREYRFLDQQRTEDDQVWHYGSTSANGKFSYLTSNMAGPMLQSHEPQDHRNQMLIVEPADDLAELGFLLNDPFLLPASFPTFANELANSEVASPQFRDWFFEAESTDARFEGFSPALFAMPTLDDASYLRPSHEMGDPGGWFL